MGEIASFAFATVANIALTFAILVWDERRLPAEQADRAWPTTTRAVAVVAFGPLCLPVHFFRTRRSWGGLALGLLAMVTVVAVDVGAGAVLDAVFEVPSDDATQ